MHCVKIIYYLLIFTLRNGIICSIVLYHFCVFDYMKIYGYIISILYLYRVIPERMKNHEEEDYRSCSRCTLCP